MGVKFLSVDPGDSVGYAVWSDDELCEAGTASAEDFEAAFAAALGVGGPSDDEGDPALVAQLRGARHVVIEDWVIYPWKARELSWDPCRTARLIGAMALVCRLAGIPYTLQPAKIKEQAEAAGAEHLFLSPLDENRHANDAMRHGVYYRKVAPHLQQGAGVGG